MSATVLEKGKEQQQGLILEFENRSLKVLKALINLSRDSEPESQVRVESSRVGFILPLPALSFPQKQGLIAASVPALSLLVAEEAQRLEAAESFSPRDWLSGCQPAAYCYAGHQFGLFSGQLGDRTAVSLGQARSKARGDLWELLYKGHGPTPFTRHGDGRTTMPSAIRELLTSEALFHLGIPTVRTGWVGAETSMTHHDSPRRATSLHLAPTFLRFGSFEVCLKSDPVTGQGGPLQGHYAKVLPGLLDHIIESSFPSIWSQHLGSTLRESPHREKRDMYTDFFIEVVRRSGALAAAWASVGFCHGMLNTEKMSIVGLSMEMGSSAFLDRYNPGFAPSTEDAYGRYNFENQMGICRYNCMLLGEALAGPALKGSEEILPKSRWKRHLETFDQEYHRVYLRLMRQKLGLQTMDDVKLQQTVSSLLQVMYETGADFTRTFRLLARVYLPAPSAQSQGPESSNEDGLLEEILSQLASKEELLADSKPCIEEASLHMLRTLGSNNRDPSLLAPLGFTPQMLELETKKLARWKQLQARSSMDQKAASRAAWEGWLRQYRDLVQAETAAGADASGRMASMNAVNPSFVVRESALRRAIELADFGDVSEVRRLLKRLETPFAEEP